MDHLEILHEIRLFVVQDTGIAPETELKISGADFNTSGKSFWVEEHLIGGEARNMSNLRGRTSSYLIQYDCCTPVGTGMERAEHVAGMIEEHMLGRTFQTNNAIFTVRFVKTSRAEGKVRNAVSVLLTLDVQERFSRPR